MPHDVTDPVHTQRMLVIYHAHCIDGFTAAWAARRADPGAEFIAATHGDPPPDVTGRDVMILDFSYPRDTVIEMHRRARSLTVLDHHKSAAEDLAGLSFALFDMDRSGAGLAWDGFHGDLRPWLVDYVEDRDLWAWKLHDSEAVNAYIATVPQTFEAWDRLLEQGLDAAIARGRPIVAFMNQYIDEAVRDARIVRFEGFDVPVVNCSKKLASEVVGRLAETAPFAIGWMQRADGRFVYSLRSRGADGEDVAVIAKRYGGGGHRNAAGFTAERLVF